MQTLMVSSFRDLNSSAGISSHPLALLTVVLLKGHWTLYFRMSGSGCDYTVEVRNRFKGLDLIDRVPEELYKKDLNESDYDDDVISYPGADILECEVKWALRSTSVNKTSGCDEIPVDLFKSLKEDAIKVLHSSCQQIWKTRQWAQDWKRSTLIPIPKKGST